jgi:hypothetical protein
MMVRIAEEMNRTDVMIRIAEDIIVSSEMFKVEINSLTSILSKALKLRGY